MTPILCLFLAASGAAQEGVPLFTSDFPPEEFKARREKVYATIGNGLALIQGAPNPAGYTRFRQSNELYYLSGIETPHAYLLLDGGRKTATVYLPHRNEPRERSEGKLLAAEDADLVKQLSGIDAVAGLDLLGEHLARQARTAREMWTPFQPAEGMSMSRDLALRFIGDTTADPFDGRPSREGQLIYLLRTRFPQFEVRDLTPALDGMRRL